MIQKLNIEKLKGEIYLITERLEREFPNYLNGARETIKEIIENYENSRLTERGNKND